MSRQKSVEEIVAKLKSLADPEAVEGMARYVKTAPPSDVAKMSTLMIPLAYWTECAHI